MQIERAPSRIAVNTILPGSLASLRSNCKMPCPFGQTQPGREREQNRVRTVFNSQTYSAENGEGASCAETLSITPTMGDRTFFKIPLGQDEAMENVSQERRPMHRAAGRRGDPWVLSWKVLTVAFNAPAPKAAHSSPPAPSRWVQEQHLSPPPPANAGVRGQGRNTGPHRSHAGRLEGSSFGLPPSHFTSQ